MRMAGPLPLSLTRLSLSPKLGAQPPRSAPPLGVGRIGLQPLIFLDHPGDILDVGDKIKDRLTAGSVGVQPRQHASFPEMGFRQPDGTILAYPVITHTHYM